MGRRSKGRRARMKNIETPRKKHAGKGIDGFEKTMEQTMVVVVVVEGGERKIRRTGRKYLSVVLISLRKEDPA